MEIITQKWPQFPQMMIGQYWLSKSKLSDRPKLILNNATNYACLGAQFTAMKGMMHACKLYNVQT